MKLYLSLPFLFLASAPAGSLAKEAVVRVGSKIFTESYVMAELLAQKLEQVDGVRVERKFGLGATGVALQALESGAVDLVPEYSGTLAESYLRNQKDTGPKVLAKELDRVGLVMSGSLGFNNTYALAMQRQEALRLGVRKISDLTRLSVLKIGFTHEFMRRADGWPNLQKRYNLKNFPIQEMEHNLSLRALSEGKVDLIDVYSTDAKLSTVDFVLLEDDLNYFPRYEALILARKQWVQENPLLWEQLASLQGALSETKMMELNSVVDLEKKSFAEAAESFLGSRRASDSGYPKWVVLTGEHLYLVLLPVFLAIVVGIPLGFLSYRYPWLGQFTLGLSSVIQTIPSLALLAFMIPVLGIGKLPALTALFLYSLLPIVLGTNHGLASISPKLREVARALGIPRRAMMFRIEWPLAFPAALNGIKTAMIYAIGTATLAALIGAGGFGNLIITGLAVNDMGIVLEGAVPAAAMALFALGFFRWIELRFIAKGIGYSRR